MTDDELRENDHESAPAPEPVRDPVSDEIAAAILERFPGTVFVESHGQPVVYVDRNAFADVAGSSATSSSSA